MTISDSLVREWKSDGGRQIIGQAALYPVWLARKQWSGLLSGRRVFIFIDNNGSKDSIVRGFTFSRTGNWIVGAIIDLEFSQVSWNWYARVPTSSNPADDPSRLDSEALVPNGLFTQVFPQQPRSFAFGKPS